MRFLIVGAGALGGYFGGRLLEAGQDVTFLLRPRRAAQLEKTGLIIKSTLGDVALPPPPYVLAEDLVKRSGVPFDVIIVGCKAYDLGQTMESFAAAVGPDTVILPLLNGMRHLDQLSQRFGQKHVLGGQCLISAALNPDGIVMHLNDTHGLSFGELNGSNTDRIDALKAAFADARFDGKASAIILQEMWEKWVFIASAASITCLMRATVGDIVSAGASDIVLSIFEEGSAIALQNGFALRPAVAERGRSILTAIGSPLTASMFKDIARGAPIEADHIIGDLLGRSAVKNNGLSLLRVAYAHLKIYEVKRARGAAEAVSLLSV
ncbi:ketopantoate reductase family protein [Glaciimonas sp. PAMC28666]|uniref:ketopantoate reductase family protein n=1 Tax=Glaciimonas sp. PAMC28666 TaxID=2807626 RepID=UPI0019662AD3|nr:ketopantoate reductase family protein [Glaciimonas sp. PAMC28666]QRX82057.1 ketopantoate reductase family protein [Glaciimonas sp. PAMC28666]